MKKFIQNKLKDQKGLTLIELLAVIVILAIIAAIAIPAIGNVIENSRVGTAKSDYINAIAAAELYLLDNPNGGTGAVVGSTTQKEIQLTDLLGTSGTTESYLDDQGSLTAFDYDPTAKTFSGSATQGSVTLEADAGTTKENITDLKNSDETATGTLTLTR